MRGMGRSEGGRSEGGMTTASGLRAEIGELRDMMQDLQDRLRGREQLQGGGEDDATARLAEAEKGRAQAQAFRSVLSNQL